MFQPGTSGPIPNNNLDLAAGAAAIDAEAAAIERGAVPGAAAPAAPPVVVEIDWTREATDLTDFCTEMFFPLYPRLAEVWAPERKAALVNRLAPVLRKYDLNLERILGKWGPEIMLAAVVAPQVLPTFRAIKQSNAEAVAAVREKARAAPPANEPAAAPPAQPGAPEAAPRVAPAPDPLQLHKLV